MKLNQNWKIIFTIAGVVIAVYLIWFFRAIIGYALVAIVISFMGAPLMDLLHKIRIRGWIMPSWLRACITLGVFLGVLYLLVKLFAPLVAEEVRILSEVNPAVVAERLEEQLAKISDTFSSVNENFDDTSMTEYLVASAQDLLSFSWLQSFFNNVFGVIGSILIATFAILFMTFFFLKDGFLFTRIVFTLTPEKKMEAMKNIMEHTHKLLRKFFIGIAIQSILMALMVGLGLYILGVKNALLIGLFAGVVNVIPYIGPLMAGAFGILVAFTTSLHLDMNTQLIPLLLKVGLIFIVAQQIDGFVIQPLVVGGSVKAHPLEIFIVVLAAGTIGGILGMVLAIPAYTILRVIAREFFAEFKVVKSLTRDLTEE
ncbi:MAG: AI-2E family transporter [Flavobacteriales bacterium]|nr:AI-2E family transporter [Flavobacteriales bacterium]